MNVPVNAVSCRGALIAAAAKSQIGVSFRLHGRSPDVMLDCVGLVEVALVSAGYRVEVPTTYSMRGDFVALASHCFAASGLKRQISGALSVGDIVLVQCGPLQNHVMIAVDGGFVHAHAGLRNIVFTPGISIWQILQIWRGST